MRVHLTLFLLCSLPLSSFGNSQSTESVKTEVTKKEYVKTEAVKLKSETSKDCTAALPIPILYGKHYKDYSRKFPVSKEHPNDATEVVSLSKDLILTASTSGCMDSVDRFFNFKINRKLTPEEEKRDDKAWAKWTREQLNSLSLGPEFKKSFTYFMKNLNDFIQELEKGKIPFKEGSASACMFGKKTKRDEECVFENGGEYLFSLKKEKEKEKDKFVVEVGAYYFL